MAMIEAPAVFISGASPALVIAYARPVGGKVVSEKAQPLRAKYIPFNTPKIELARVWRKEATYAVSPEFPYGTTDTSGHYAAVIKQNNVPLANCRVALYWRDTMQLIAKGMSNANGEFRFDGLIPNVNRYFAIALDPEGGVFQNALIYDRLTAIK